MKLAVVTGADKKYLPGVRALYNSFVTNGKIDCDFILFCHGVEEDFSEVDDNIIKIFNPNPVKSPTSREWPDELPAMYSRVMIPRILSDYDRVLWLDADMIILKEIDWLFKFDLEDKPLAATFPGADFQRKEWQFMPFQLENPEKYPEMRSINSLQAGTLLYDINKWKDLNLDEVVDQLLLSDIKFKYVVQGLLGFALKGNFKRLHDKWNCPVSWLSHYKLEDIAILHYVGGAGKNPWQYEMPQKQLWQKYYNIKGK